MSLTLTCGINNSPAVSLERFDLFQLRVRGAVRTFRKRVYLPRRYVVVFHVYEVWSPFSRIPLSNTGRWIAQLFLLILTLAVCSQRRPFISLYASGDAKNLRR